MITYPLAMPGGAKFKTALIRPQNVVGMTQAPLSLVEQVQAFDGNAWHMQLTLPVMTKAQARKWLVFLVSLHGIKGTFLANDTYNDVPKGVMSGAPVVNGSGNKGYELPIRGMDNGLTQAIAEGDFVQVGTGIDATLHMALGNLDSDGSGEGVLDIWPRLRNEPDDGVQIITASPRGLFRLATNNEDWRRNLGLFEITINCVEAVR